MVKSTAIPVLIVFIARAFGQTAPPQPAFEVASIRAAPPQEIGRVSTRMSTDRGRLNYTNVSLGDVIVQAYGVQHNQISGPAWLETGRFDIVAKIPEDAAKDQISRMFQALLADRFKLKLHREKKELPVYALVAGKNGPKIEKVESTGGLSINRSGTHSRVTGRVTMSWFADYLAQRLGRPVLDQTKLDGAYSITLEWVLDSTEQPGPAPGQRAVPDDAASGPSLFTAVQEQLGLKLVATKGPVDILVIDQLEKVPTDN